MRRQKHRRCPTRVDRSIDAVLQGSMELASISKNGSTGVYFNPLASVGYHGKTVKTADSEIAVRKIAVSIKADG